MTPPSCMTEPATKPRLLELALTFNKISLVSFGGGLSAWARRVIVEEKKWLDDEEFLSALTLSRVLPGANQMNFAVYVGNRFHGFEGAIAAVLGLITVPFLIILALAYVYVPPQHDTCDTGRAARCRGRRHRACTLNGAENRREVPVQSDGFALRGAGLCGVRFLEAPAHRRPRHPFPSGFSGGMAAPHAKKRHLMKPILSLITFFSVLSILSIGGSNSVVPEMARHAVEVEHWLTAAQFTDIFAISQTAPGPSNLIVALIGFKVAGFWGALVAQLAMMLPAASLMLLVSRISGGLVGKPLAPRAGAWPCADRGRPHLRKRLDHCRRREVFQRSAT